MSRPEESNIRGLCELLVRTNFDVPIRLMEEILEHGDKALEPLLETLGPALDQALARAGRDADEEAAYDGDGAEDHAAWDDDDADDEEHFNPVWPLVLLGVLGNPAAVPALADTIRRAAQGHFPTPLAASEALARIGTEALPALKELARDPDPVRRIWAYGALGWIADDEAYEFLIESLSTDPEALDAVASALHPHGRAEAIPFLYDALERAEPWQRIEIQAAIQDLHAENAPEPFHEQDWRLRYRPEPAIGAMAPSWPMIAVLAREGGIHAKRSEVPVRPLDEILAEAPSDPPREPCECCGVPTFEGTGMAVCPQTAVAVTMLQREILGSYRDEGGVDDLFELLTEVEFEAMEIYHWEPEPRSRKARQRRDDRLTELQLARGACRWLIQQGVESVGGGRATLLAESLRLAHEHGDPNGFFTDPGPVKRTGPQVGRNDPCPCGSGRKFKKCCGHPSRAGASPSSPSAGAPASVPAGRGPVGASRSPGGPGPGMPELRTFDGEPLSFGRAHYRVSDRAAVREALEGCPDLEENPDDGSFTWSRQIDDDEWRVLGNIQLEGDKLILECMSDERLAGGKALLAELAGEHLVHRADTTQDPWQAVQEARESGGASRAREGQDALPPELAGQAIQAIQAFLDRHYATWPDQPLPALGGRTAREAVGSPAGRKDVVALLRYMEEMDAQRPADQRYDFGKLWTELGIEALR